MDGFGQIQPNFFIDYCYTISYVVLQLGLPCGPKKTVKISRFIEDLSGKFSLFLGPQGSPNYNRPLSTPLPRNQLKTTPPPPEINNEDSDGGVMNKQYWRLGLERAREEGRCVISLACLLFFFFVLFVVFFFLRKNCQLSFYFGYDTKQKQVFFVRWEFGDTYPPYFPLFYFFASLINYQMSIFTYLPFPPPFRFCFFHAP